MRGALLQHPDISATERIAAPGRTVTQYRDSTNPGPRSRYRPAKPPFSPSHIDVMPEVPQPAGLLGVTQGVVGAVAA